MIFLYILLCAANNVYLSISFAFYFLENIFIFSFEDSRDKKEKNS